MKLPIARIEIDPELVVRDVNDPAVCEYSDRIAAGDEFPPIAVWKNAGRYFLVCGRHRLDAHKQADLVEIQAEVFGGSKGEAVVRAFTDNSLHGRRLSPGEQINAAERLLRLFEDYSGTEVAEMLGCSNYAVRQATQRINGAAGPSGGDKSPTEPSGTEDLEAPWAEESPEEGRVIIMIGSHRCKLPEELEPVWEAAGPAREFVSLLRGATKQFDAVCRLNTGMYIRRQHSTLLVDGKYRNNDIIDLWCKMRDAVPYAPCPYCWPDGDECLTCSAEGWVDKVQWELATEEQRNAVLRSMV